MEEKKRKPRKISEIGEFGLIDHLTSKIELKNPQSFKGIGDDAAVLDYKDKRIIVTTDMLTEGIHFNLVYTPLKHLGYKAVMVNLSDIYAMNAEPKQVLISVAVSSKFSVEAIEELYSGIKLACERYNIDIVGGDTTSSMTGLVISVTAIGEADPGNIIYRNRAELNDIICVSGDLGGAYLGLQLLERESELFAREKDFQPKLEGYDYILERQLKPEARRDIVAGLKKEGILPTSMIDISDGLSSELMHICSKSDKGCRIYEDRLPIHSNTIKMATEMKINPITCALNGGEDYELLFTIPVKDHEKAENLPDVSIIGHITDKSEKLHLVSNDGNLIPLKAQGWNSFPD